ncbi:MAG: rhodanese-like domain-containing protein [Alphaproteobacteria bacterium]
MSIKVNSYGSVALDSFLENLENIQLIDVRSKIEWDDGHFKNAKLMPLDNFLEHVEDIDASQPTIFICAKGLRAAIAWEMYKKYRPDALLSGYIVAEVDYTTAEPTLYAMSEEWHKEIAKRIDML